MASSAPAASPPTDNKKERERLARRIAADFALTREERAQLAVAIADASTTAALAAIEAWAQNLGIDLGDDYALPKSLEHGITEKSLGTAHGMADAYDEDLERHINTLLEDYEREYGRLSDAETMVKPQVGEWASRRASWKSPQVANWETGNAAGQGTQSLIGDILDGSALDSEGNAIDASDVELLVLPDSSSDDEICGMYAGGVYSIQDAGEIPFYPAHMGCDHYIAIVYSNGVEYDDFE